MNQNNPLPERLWTVNDVAHFLQLSKSWVYKEAEAGRLPCIRIGASLRFVPESIQRFMNGNQRANVLPLPVRNS